MTINTNHEHTRKSMGMREYHANQLICIRIQQKSMPNNNQYIKIYKHHKHLQCVFVNDCNYCNLSKSLTSCKSMIC